MNAFDYTTNLQCVGRGLKTNDTPQNPSKRKIMGTTFLASCTPKKNYKYKARNLSVGKNGQTKSLLSQYCGYGPNINFVGTNTFKLPQLTSNKNIQNKARNVVKNALMVAATTDRTQF